jgi:hypothetical protein
MPGRLSIELCYRQFICCSDDVDMVRTGSFVDVESRCFYTTAVLENVNTAPGHESFIAVLVLFI